MNVFEKKVGLVNEFMNKSEIRCSLGTRSKSVLSKCREVFPKYKDHRIEWNSYKNCIDKSRPKLVINRRQI